MDSRTVAIWWCPVGPISRHPVSRLQLTAGLLLKPLPQGVGVLEQRDVAGVLEVRAAEDPGLTACGTAVVAGGEPVVPDDLGTSGRQPPGGLAAHRSDADDGDALPGS